MREVKHLIRLKKVGKVDHVIGKQRTIELIMLLLKKTVSGDIMVFIKSKGDGNQLCDSLNREMSNFRKQFIKKTKKKSRTHNNENQEVKQKNNKSIKKKFTIKNKINTA